MIIAGVLISLRLSISKRNVILMSIVEKKRLPVSKNTVLLKIMTDCVCKLVHLNHHNCITMFRF